MVISSFEILKNICYGLQVTGILSTKLKAYIETKLLLTQTELTLKNLELYKTVTDIFQRSSHETVVYRCYPANTEMYPNENFSAWIICIWNEVKRINKDPYFKTWDLTSSIFLVTKCVVKDI